FRPVGIAAEFAGHYKQRCGYVSGFEFRQSVMREALKSVIERYGCVPCAVPGYRFEVRRNGSCPAQQHIQLPGELQPLFGWNGVIVEDNDIWTRSTPHHPPDGGCNRATGEKQQADEKINGPFQHIGTSAAFAV